MRQARLVLVSLTLAATASAGPSVTLKSGKPCARSGDACPAIEAGAALSDGTLVEVPEGEQAVVDVPGGAVTVHGGTQLKVGGTTKLKVGHKKQDTPAVVMTIVRGRVSVSLGERGSHAVLVRGPGEAQAIVTTGETSVRNEGGLFAVKTTKGSALIAAGNDWTDVAPGTVRFLRKGDAKSEWRKLRDAPRLTAPRTIVTTLDRAGTFTTTLEPVLGAHGYETALFAEGRDGEGVWKKLATSPQSADPITASWADAPGAWVLRARALDKEGIEGDWSAPVRVTIVGVTLPKGAAPITGGFELPLRRRLSFVGVDDVEMALGGGTFSKAPSEVSLLADAPQTLRLRKAGQTDEVSWKLVPRTMRAEVIVGPKTATWPKDAISITVRVVGTVPEGVELRPRVTLGLDPIEVAFERRGADLVATVPPRVITKQTVLRVDVRDDEGAEVGRGFLEIVPTK